MKQNQSNTKSNKKPSIINQNQVNIPSVGDNELEPRRGLFTTDLTNTGWHVAYRIAKIEYFKTLIEKIKDESELAEIARIVFAHPNFNPDLVDIKTERRREISNFTPAEHWADRDKSKKEAVVDFINRVYNEALDGYFSVSDLHAHDPKLKQALYNWARDHNEGKRPLFEILNLPTKKQVNDILLAEITDSEQVVSAKQRAKSRIHSVSLTRAHRERN